MPVLMITGTGTEIGKTVTTAAVAAAALAAGRSVAVLKAAQTGVGPDERGDADEVARKQRRRRPRGQGGRLPPAHRQLHPRPARAPRQRH
ncbi:AAA family ATPase, partial [Streptomyces sp. NPDC004561]